MNIRAALTGGAFLASILVISGSGSAQVAEPSSPNGSTVPPQSRSAPAYGTAGVSIDTINAFGFTTYTSGVTFDASGGSRWLTGAGTWVAPVVLPSGASVTGIEIQGCDDAPAGYLDALFYKSLITAGSESSMEIGEVATDDSPTLGCGYYAATLAQPETIDNLNNTYWVSVSHIGTPLDGSTRFQAVRLRCNLQVSAAPTTATFSDVPTSSPQFRFVEALVAAGITAGCGGGAYCPNQPVTRGQMAVFLSAALGLYWPN